MHLRGFGINDGCLWWRHARSQPGESFFQFTCLAGYTIELLAMLTLLFIPLSIFPRVLFFFFDPLSLGRTLIGTTGFCLASQFLSRKTFLLLLLKSLSRSANVT